MSGTTRTTKGIRNIGRYRKAYVRESFDRMPLSAAMETVGESLKHTYPRVAGSTATKPHNNMSGSFPDGISYQLPGTIARCYHRVTFLTLQQCQSTGLRHLYHRSLTMKQIIRPDGSHQRVAHRHLYQSSAEYREESLQETFAAIAYSHLYDLSIRTNIL